MADNDNLITPAGGLTGIVRAPPLKSDDKKKRRENYNKQNNKLKQSSDEPEDRIQEENKTMISKDNAKIIDYLA